MRGCYWLIICFCCEIAAFQPAMAQEAGLAGSYLAGQYARSQGDIAGAVHYLQNVHKSQPGDESVTSQLQGLLLLNGQVDEAIALSSELKSAESTDPLLALLGTVDAVKRKQIEDAQKSMGKVLDSGGNLLWVPLVSGWLDAEQGKLKKPIKIEELSADVGRSAPIVAFHLGLINARAGFKDAAYANFNSALSHVANPPQRMAEMVYAVYLANDKPKALDPLARKLLAANPELESSRTPLVNSTRSGIAEVLFTMGSLMQNAGAEQDALIYMQLALYLEPKSVPIAVTLADVYIEAQNYAKANSLLATVPKDSQYYATARLRMAVNLSRMKHVQDGIALLDEMAKENPEAVEPLMARGDLLRNQKQYAQAIETYSQALERITSPQPNHWAIYFARAVCYEQLGSWQLAEADLKKALSLSPEQADVLNYLGFSWLSQHRNVSDARSMIAKALSARPNDPQIIDSMGWAYYVTGEYDQAADFLERAVEMLPGDPTVNDHLGDAYWRLGRKTEARFQWNRALSFSPEQDAAQEISRKLKDGLPPGAKNHIPPLAAENQSPKDTTAQ